ncbi:MAG TPA: DUF2786 domain-containing protein [Kofleriaceae bacterium]|nr:DUF2786 domain-containing protein [Kofleriaceae bacterium]
MDSCDAAPHTEALSAALEAALLRQLRNRYLWENQERFGNRLTPPVIVLSDGATHLGRWISATRTLEISRKLVLDRPWLEVTSVLEHEMAHQYVEEILQVRDETAHGETFRRVCAQRGIDARAAGPVPPSDDSSSNPSSDGEPGTDRVLERIRKLLALAGSPNQHEAEIAMRKAHELMLRHNIEATTAQNAGHRGYEVRHLGDPLRRRTRVESDVAGLLSEFFFVKVIRVPIYLPRLAKTVRVYEIAGTRANVEMASHVYAFLLGTAERLWNENRHDARVRNGRDRLAYQSGVVGGFREKLLSERVDLKKTGLVWLGDRDLDGFYRARHPRITTQRHRVRINGAHAAGREAGRTVVLHKPVERGASGSGPRLLRG